MTSFRWKRKAGGSISKEVSKAFEADSKPNTDELSDSDIDWISLAPKQKVLVLEDVSIKTSRLKKEGATLAEAGRYWEAVRKWNEALQLMPNDEKLYEMKSQVLLLLNEVYPAVTTAEKCVNLNSNWWVGYQTLGRAQLAVGEVRMALRSFSIALHLNPADEELWKDDFNWALDLLHKKSQMEHQIKEMEDQPKIIEIETDNLQKDMQERNRGEDCQADLSSPSTVSDSHSKKLLKHMPANYVFMRDKL